MTHVFSEQWRGVEGLYGGYVLGWTIDACHAIPDLVPLSTTIQFLGTVRPGAADWEHKVLRRGLTTATVTGELRQEHVKVVAMAKLGQVTEPLFPGLSPDFSDLPQPEELPPYSVTKPPLTYESLLDHRLLPDTNTNRQRRTLGWVRLRDPDRAVSLLGPYGLCGLLLDVQPPGVFFLEEPAQFVPTIDFTIHFTPGGLVDVGEWHLVEQVTSWSTHEFCVEESRLYDRSGRFIAEGRQSRRIVWNRANDR